VADISYVTEGTLVDAALALVGDYNLAVVGVART